MKDWVLSQEGEKWTVQLDVRDLGGHLDTTFRGWSAAARVRLVVARLVLVLILPLPFHGRVRVVWTMFIPGALHDIEASLLSSSSLRKLRSSTSKVVRSRRQSLANVGSLYLACCMRSCVLYCMVPVPYDSEVSGLPPF